MAFASGRLGVCFSRAMNRMAAVSVPVPLTTAQRFDCLLGHELASANLAAVDTAHSRLSVRDFFQCKQALATADGPAFSAVLDRMLDALKRDPFCDLGSGLFARVLRLRGEQAQVREVRNFLDDVARHCVMKYAVGRYPDTGEIVLVYGAETYHKKLLAAATAEGEVAIQLVGAGMVGRLRHRVDLDGRSTDFTTDESGIKVHFSVERLPFARALSVAPDAGLPTAHQLLSALLFDAGHSARVSRSLELEYPPNALTTQPS